MTLDGIERYPRSKDAVPSFREAFRHYVLPPYIPPKPIFSRSDAIVTQGSCFAANVAKTMTAIGVKAYWLEIQEVMNSPLANRTYLEYLLTGKPITIKNHKIGLQSVVGVQALVDFKSALESAAGFVFTAGLAYCWFAEDGEFQLVGVKGVPGKAVLTTTDQNQEHIEAIISMVRAVNPAIKIILTVSPIPLTRAPGQGSAFTADCLSKSTLRVAVNQVMAQKIPDVYYWPSFDAIRWLSGHVGPLFGVEGEDQRHPGQSYIDEILGAFVEHFFLPVRGRGLIRILASRLCPSMG